MLLVSRVSSEVRALIKSVSIMGLMLLLASGSASSTTSLPNGSQPTAGQPLSIDVLQAEAVLMSTSFALDGAHFYDVKRVKLLDLPTRSEPLVGFCARATTNPYSFGISFLAWRAQPNSPTHVLQQDVARHRAIYDQFCLRSPGEPISLPDRRGRATVNQTEPWPGLTWSLLALSFLVGVLSGVILLNQSGFARAQSSHDRFRDQRPAVHLRAEDYY